VFWFMGAWLYLCFGLWGHGFFRDLHLCFGLWERGCIGVLVYGGVASSETCICVLVYGGVAVFVFSFMGIFSNLMKNVIVFPMLLPSSRSKNQIFLQMNFPISYVSTDARRDVYFTYF
jgi:hypothetical protein